METKTIQIVQIQSLMTADEFYLFKDISAAMYPIDNNNPFEISLVGYHRVIFFLELQLNNDSFLEQDYELLNKLRDRMLLHVDSNAYIAF
jgi:hypothetical protein